MKVFVTGGCGFLGSHVCEYFKKLGHHVISFDNMTKYELDRVGYNSNLSRKYNWNFLKAIGVEMIKGDVLNYDLLKTITKDIDFIIHTAAQPAMTIAIENPILDFKVNVEGTFNVLKIVREINVPMVSCGTIHIYGNEINDGLQEIETRYTREPESINELEKVSEGNLTPLHASKRSAELYIESFIKTYKVNAASFRLTGIYGTRQFGGEDHGWVANFVIRAIKNKKIKIFGNGKQVRDIIYATDVARAMHQYYLNKSSGVFNIGGGIDYSISLIECIDLIKNKLNKEINIEYYDKRFGDLSYFVCDIDKAKNKLNWSPEITPNQGLEKLIDWVNRENKIFQ